MSFFKSLGLLVRLAEYLAKVIERLGLEKKKKDLKDAKDEAIESRDQRPIEESLGGGGKPTRRKYSGMHTRPRKKRE